MKLAFVFSSLTAILLCSCQSRSDQAGYDRKDAAYDSTGSVSTPVKMVKTGAIQCQVHDVHQSTKSIAALLSGFGGALTHQDFTTSAGERKELKLSKDSLLTIATYTPHADLTARVPVEHLEEFLFAITDSAAFVSASNLDIQDKGLDYLALHLKQKNRIASINGMSKRTDSAITRSIERRDEVVDQEIAKRQIDADARFSTVHLALNQNTLIRKEVIANYYLSGYELSFGKRLQQAFSDGWYYVLSFIIAITHLWGFIVLGVVVWTAVVVYQRQKKGSVAKG